MYPFTDFKSYNHWTQDDQHVAQRFYVTVCLYVSAVSDYSIGLDLREDNKLNWSATASYYSMVHSARMATFAAVGDFPTGHGPLGKLFGSGCDGQGSNQPVVEYSCDWLKKFFRKTGVDFARITGQAARISLQDISRHYDQMLAEDLGHSFRAAGKVLFNAKELREDSNYEALLMAHEQRHLEVTAKFEVLSSEMLEGAELWLRIATHCLHRHTEHDQHLAKYRTAYSHFLNDCISKRIHSPILDRINHTQRVLGKIDEVMSPLNELLSGATHQQELAIEIKQLKDWISMSRFNQKADLMRGFGQKINSLRRDVALARQTLSATRPQPTMSA